MQLWMRILLILLVCQGAGNGALAADDVAREAAQELARRQARVRDFYAYRRAIEADNAKREQFTAEYRQARARNAEQVERARLEYIRTRPQTVVAGEDERRERLAHEELERDERRREINRSEFVRLRARLQDALSAGSQIDEMLEFDLNTERINRTVPNGK